MSRPRIPRPRRGQDGVTSLEVVVLFPLALALILLIVQVALWFFARSMALAAARAGADSGAAYTSSPAAGATAATRFASDQAGDMLTDVHASPDGSTATEVRITVTGDALSLLPGFTLSVSQTAQKPVERFTNAGN